MPRDQTLNEEESEPLWANCLPWHSENNGFVSENQKQDSAIDIPRPI
jgi:hypothetical protein